MKTDKLTATGYEDASSTLPVQLTDLLLQIDCGLAPQFCCNGDPVATAVLLAQLETLADSMTLEDVLDVITASCGCQVIGGAAPPPPPGQGR